MRTTNYEKYPAIKVDGKIATGWDEIRNIFKNELAKASILAVDMYVGICETELERNLSQLRPTLIVRTWDLLKPASAVAHMTEPFMTDDEVFGYASNLRLIDFFDEDKLAAAKEYIGKSEGSVIVWGCGASLLVPEGACLVYADISRWELQKRYRQNAVPALGLDNRNEPFLNQYKRGYFNDWRVCDIHKQRLLTRASYWLDTHEKDAPKLINKETFWNGLETTVSGPFRIVPYFAPAPWGGQWMKEKFDLDANEINYGWCFDCVPEENSLLFDIGGTRFEIPAVNLVLAKSRELLGEPVEARFGKDFPIRFDILDTMDGGSLSFQVHPTTQFIKENFGIQYTQDESYYMLDAKEDAYVYLGLKNKVDSEAMADDLRLAAKGKLDFDAEKYANKLSVKKHDHLLIPAGTVHCSGPQGLILEISATPNLFTFKMWDWGRMGLDGKPRPVNVERGIQVIDWQRDTDYTLKGLVNVFETIAEGDGWREEKTGLHTNEFIETRRHYFTGKVSHDTNDSVNVINLVEGEEAIVESPDQHFEPFVIHYAETMIIPASVQCYTIRPYGKSEGQECITIKAYVRF